MAEDEAQVGRVNGLAWTSVGELLTIEVAAVKGRQIHYNRFTR